MDTVPLHGSVGIQKLKSWQSEPPKSPEVSCSHDALRRVHPKFVASCNVINQPQLTCGSRKHRRVGEKHAYIYIYIDILIVNASRCPPRPSLV